jgi:hypothetical protein
MLAKKMKDRDAAKAIQQASLGEWVAHKLSSASSDSESDAAISKNKARPIPMRRNHVF